MIDDGFIPKVASGPFNFMTHTFCSGGSYADPSMLWFEACHPGHPRLGPVEELMRAKAASLPLGSGEIGLACETLFGQPVPKDRREFPHGADWVLTTPIDGLFLIVRLPDGAWDRFGFGIEHGLQQTIFDLSWVDDPEAREAAENRLKDAPLTTLKVIKAEMDLVPAPAP